MAGSFIVHGGTGTGSVAVEAALTLLDLAYRVEDPPSLRDPVERARFVAINPMGQLPALILPSGELMTESAAILTWLADSHPRSRLSPSPTSPRRAAFLRWMAFVSAAIYALYWIRDEPSRLAMDAAQAAVIRTRTAERIADCWAIMEAQVTPGRYLLDDDLSVLDLYVTVLSRWGPRRRRFYALAPRMGEVVRRVDADPRLAHLWARRFPFVEGWEE
jgi:GST-like protein